MVTAAEPRVSVVVPLASIDDLVRVQMDAVLSQALDETFEVVLSVNSSDATVRSGLARLVTDLADPRVRTVDSSDRRGAAHARNVGARAATGELLAFCDGDDRVHPGWLAALVAALGDGGADAVCGRVVDIYPDPRMATWRPPATDGDLPTFLGVPYLLSGNMAISREWFDKVGGFDETLTRCEDIAIGWSLVRAGATLSYVDEAALDYRHRPGVRQMLQQHYLYGKGMAEVLARDGVPQSEEGSWSKGSGLTMLRPNGQRVAKRTLVGTLRRASLAAGRVSGLIAHRFRRFKQKGASS